MLAQEESRLLDHYFIGTEHLLLGLIKEGEGVGARALESLGISIDVTRQKVKEAVGPSASEVTGSPPFTERAKRVLELSLREALDLGHNYIGTEHMLLGLVREGEGVGAQVLNDFTGDLGLVRRSVVDLLSGPAFVGEGQAEAPAGSVSRGRIFSRGMSACSHRAEDLEEALGYRRMQATADANEPVLPVVAVYCLRCGQTLAIHPDPGSTSA